MKFLFEAKFGLFELLAYGFTILLVQDHGYWWVLVMIPVGMLGNHMQNKLEIRKILEERQRGY